jgi:hypothetical protein
MLSRSIATQHAQLTGTHPNIARVALQLSALAGLDDGIGVTDGPTSTVDLAAQQHMLSRPVLWCTNPRSSERRVMQHP